MVLVLVLFAALSLATAQQRPNFTHQAVLDTNGDFIVRWLPGTNANDYITFECEVRTQGWLGIGFSSNGGMGSADMVIAWIDQNGNPQISDRHGPAQGNGFPPPDDMQNYQLLSGRKNQTHIVVSFRRLLDTCDQNDWKITSDTTRMIWAKNDQVPTSAQDIAIHTDRGVRSVHLMTEATDNGLSQVLADTSVTPFDLGVENVSIPNTQRTLYWCKIIQLPVSEKKHVVATEMKVQPGNERYVHHLIMYGCGDNDMSRFLNNPGPCFDDTQIFDPMRLCGDLLGAWAVGGEAFVYPNNMGAPIFENNNQRFVLIEMHYDNPELLSGLMDSSYYRMHLTSNLRPVETGRFSMGTPVLPSVILIPPRQPRFTIYSYCPSSCTSRFQEPMKIFSGLLHTHLLGVAIKLRVIRKGTELKSVMKDDHYDFNYQNSLLLSTPLEIQPGDDLIVECTYDTSQLDKPAVGGFQTTQEMCLTMYEYYPKRNETSDSCHSIIDQSTMLKLLGATADDLGPAAGFDYSVTVLNQNNQNKTLMDWYNTDVNWSNDTANKLQAFMKEPPQTIACYIKSSDPQIAANSSNDFSRMTQAIPITTPYVEPNTCATANTNSAVQNNNNNAVTTANYNANNGVNGNYNSDPSYNVNAANSNYNSNGNENENENENGNGNGNTAAANLLNQLGRLIQWALQQVNRS